MKRRRVKITGIGFVTPAGVGKVSFEEGILANLSYVSTLRRFPSDAGPFVASEVSRFNVLDFVDLANATRLPRHTQFALAATRLALADAGLKRGIVERLSPAVVIGTSLMDSSVISKTIENVARKGPRFGIARTVYDAPVASIPAAVATDIGGARTLSLQSTCCSGVDAIGHAAELIAVGEADIAICGGTEAPLYYHPMLELRIAGLSPATIERPRELSRPFDLWRTTGVIGEGACILLLEPECSPRAGYAIVAGYSFASDGIGKHAFGLTNAIQLCLANARTRQSEVEMINTWGPGHREIDLLEATALQQVFSGVLHRIPAVSIKGAIGNPFAAGGAIQVGCSALSLQNSFVPPTVNWQYPDPACRLNLANRPRFMRFRNVLVNAHGLSGTNACILLKRTDVP